MVQDALHVLGGGAGAGVGMWEFSVPFQYCYEPKTTLKNKDFFLSTLKHI